jgi:hypothetical protein
MNEALKELQAILEIDNLKGRLQFFEDWKRRRVHTGEMTLIVDPHALAVMGKLAGQEMLECQLRRLAADLGASMFDNSVLDARKVEDPARFAFLYTLRATVLS